MMGVILHCLASITVSFAPGFGVLAFLTFLNGVASAAIWMSGFVVGNVFLYHIRLVHESSLLENPEWNTSMY